MENEYLSLEGVRKILHISKRKCAWMLQNGVIPCEISGKKTRCYKVLRKDVEQYIIMCRQNPEANLLPKIFTSTQGNVAHYARIKTAPDGFREWLKDLWRNEKNALNVVDIEMLTGYSQTTIARWCQHGTLRHVTVRGDVIIARTWLIDFMCGYGWRIVKKSERHLAIMGKYF